MLTASDIRGVYAIIPTPARDGADHWSSTDLTPANPQDKTPMPFHNGREGVLVLSRDEALQQLPVRELPGLPSSRRTPEVADGVVESFAHHRFRMGTEPSGPL